LFELLFSRPNFAAFIALFLLGLTIMVTHHNLIKKLIGMYLVQTSIIFFFVTTGAKFGSTVPILLSTEGPIEAHLYANPLPHALVLTAIVVGISTLGVSLGLTIAIYRRYGSLEEDEILKRLE
jgi:multicomponent Na+:H+ antiporter subunit C